MANIKIYIEVNADILGDQGILDVIKTPIDGINRHPNIPWARVCGLTVQAMYISREEDSTLSYHHHMYVNFKNERPRPMGFVLQQNQNESFEVSTVAGTQAGLVSLNPETSATIARLLFESMQSECD